MTGPTPAPLTVVVSDSFECEVVGPEQGDSCHIVFQGDRATGERVAACYNACADLADPTVVPDIVEALRGVSIALNSRFDGACDDEPWAINVRSALSRACPEGPSDPSPTPEPRPDRLHTWVGVEEPRQLGRLHQFVTVALMNLTGTVPPWRIGRAELKTLEVLLETVKVAECREAEEQVRTLIGGIQSHTWIDVHEELVDPLEGVSGGGAG